MYLFFCANTLKKTTYEYNESDSLLQMNLPKAVYFYSKIDNFFPGIGSGLFADCFVTICPGSFSQRGYL